ncbi:hypothetical protein LXA43DRAFT_972714 [Ganoderma leucocontextum]|nr:hypothetical protein LXA43DRAFT_972714 [Ganoderma leucocontextum]
MWLSAPALIFNLTVARSSYPSITMPIPLRQKKELKRKLIPTDDTGSEYLSKYVPSTTPYAFTAATGDEFVNYKPVKGGEVDSYPSFIAGLDALLASFPTEKRVTFFDCHTKMQHFHYSSFAANHRSSYPDIAVSFPGQILDAQTSSLDWSNFSMIIELKAETGDDPLCNRGLNFLACFVIGVYGDIFRISRFDHSGAVFSKALSLRDVDDLKIIQQFFWRFANPAKGNSIVGCDPTIRRLTSDDEVWLKNRLEFIGVSVEDVVLSEARRAEILDEDVLATDLAPPAYILLKALDVNGRLFSRATTVWLGIRDTSRLVNGRLIDLPVEHIPPEDLKMRITKDAWRQLVRRPEKDFYTRLSRIPANECVGLPSLQTFTRRQARGSEYWHRERSHMRFVVDKVGRPLYQFRNTREMAIAVRDAIRGHRVAMSCAGILHRDISINNILIVDDLDDQAFFGGFIHDFDYSSMSRKVPTSSLAFLSVAALTELLVGDDYGGELKERTGTFYFMAATLLSNEGKIHGVQHDLESFYWVLLWNVLRYTEHNHPDGQNACPNIFKLGSEPSFGSKLMWLSSNARTKLSIKNNLPLSTLLKEFGDLCFLKVFPHADPLDYDQVLTIFDKMLDSDKYKSRWPEDNLPLEYDLPDTRVKDELSSGERRSQKRAAGSGKRKRKTKKARVPDPDSETDMEDENRDFEFYDDLGDEDTSVRVMPPDDDDDAADVLVPSDYTHLLETELSPLQCIRNTPRGDVSFAEACERAKRRRTAASGAQPSIASGSTNASTTLAGTSSGSTLGRNISERELRSLGAGASVDIESWRGPARNTRSGSASVASSSRVQAGGNMRVVPQVGAVGRPARGHIAHGRQRSGKERLARTE